MESQQSTMQHIQNNHFALCFPPCCEKGAEQMKNPTLSSRLFLRHCGNLRSGFVAIRQFKQLNNKGS